eukprot:TRINITY_DN92766_c0_g1_i1.p1 TRINITY_DN92766_c0_g1~~TRINITY_DN92766_c0_g1_i1.p1  ORF type:complete len:460 (-),score=71.33 TRINITY_DN92766_c0_g1_i1:101-1480(-)
MDGESLWEEAFVQFRLALPIAGANLLQRSATWITWACVGHLGAEFLGPVTLASSVNNVLGTSVVGGLSLGTSTLASQAYGAQDNAALGKVLQRSILIALLGSLPCVAILIVIKPLTLSMGMTQEFADRAGNYGRAVLLVTPCTGIQRAIGMWLVSQKITLPRLVIQAVALPFQALLTWYLTFGTSLHYIGAGIAMSLSTFLQLALTYGYILCSPRFSSSWKGFDREACSDWQPYLQVAVPGVLMNAEYFVGEFLTFAASLLPHPEVCLSALSIYQLTQTTCYQIPSGVRMAICARVGSQLGAGDAALAELSQKAGLRLILLWILIPTTTLLIFTRQWGLIFTTDEQVLVLLRSLVAVMLLYSDADAILAFYNGVLTSCGQQALSGKWAIRAYVFIGLPIAVALAFGLSLGALGLVTGHTLGKLCHVLACRAGVRRIDWRSESDAAIQRVQRLSRAPRSF